MKNRKIKAKKDDASVTFTCEGGGRIEHQYQGEKCSIYGYSQSYGHVDHNIAKDIVLK